MEATKCANDEVDGKPILHGINLNASPGMRDFMRKVSEANGLRRPLRSVLSPRPDDVIINTIARSGTTLTIQVLRKKEYGKVIAAPEWPLHHPKASWTTQCKKPVQLVNYKSLGKGVGPLMLRHHAISAKNSEAEFDVGEIAQMLRSGGSMSFENLNDEVPFLNRICATESGNPDGEQKWAPRLFKSHMMLDDGFPTGQCKTIVVVRNPLDTAKSQYFHKIQRSLDPGVHIDECVLITWCRHSRPWDILLSWFGVRGSPSVLYLFYEDLVESKVACARLVAKFMGLDAGDSDLINKAVDRSSREFMDAHKSQYLPKHQGNDGNRDRHAELFSENSEVEMERNRASVEQAKKTMVLGGNVIKELQNTWTKRMAPVTGYATYEDFRAGVNEELKRPY